MITHRFAILSVFVMAAAFIAGCAAHPPINNENFLKYDNRILAKGDHGYDLTAREMYEALWSSQLMPEGGVVDPATAVQFRDSLLMDTLSGFEAEEDYRLADYRPEYRNYQLQYDDFLLKSYVEQLVSDSVILDSAAVKAHVLKNPDRYTIEEQIEIYHVLVSPRYFLESPDSAYYRTLSKPELDEAVKNYADSLYQMLQNGEAFPDVAYAYSHDKLSQQYGGYIGWVRRGMFIDPFDSIAFSMEVGNFSKPYRDKDGWHMVYVSDHVPAGLTPLDRPQLYDAALKDLLSEETGKLTRRIIDSLSKNMKLDINEAVLDSNVFSSPDSITAAVVNGADSIDFLLLRTLEMSYRQAYKVSNTTPQIKKQMIDQLAGRALLLQAARASGMDTLPGIRKEDQRLQHLALRGIVLRDRFSDLWRPDDSALSAYYQAHLEDFAPSKPFTVSEVVVKDSVLAEFIRDQAMSGIEMKDLAKDYQASQRTLKASYVNLGEIGQADVDSAVWAAIQDVPAGQVAPVVKIGDSYHVVKVASRKQVLSLMQAQGQVSSLLINQYKRDRVRAYTQELIARYHVTFPEKLPEFYLKPLRYRIDTAL